MLTRNSRPLYWVTGTNRRKRPAVILIAYVSTILTNTNTRHVRGFASKRLQRTVARSPWELKEWHSEAAEGTSEIDECGHFASVAREAVIHVGIYVCMFSSRIDINSNG